MLSAGVRAILFPGYCSQAQAFFARAPGLNGTRKRLYDRFIGDRVASGVWAKLDAVYIWSAPTQTTGVLNLKSASFPCTPNGTVSFTADRGFLGNAGNFFLDSGFNPNTAAGNFVQDGASWGVYNLTNRAATSNKHSCGCDNSGAFTRIANLTVFDSASNNLSTFTNNATATSNAATGASQGSWSVSRTGATAGSICRNGTQLATFVTASVGLPTSNFYFFAINIGGTFGAVADEMSAGFIGGAMTSAELNDLSNGFNTFMAGLPTPINLY